MRDERKTRLLTIGIFGVTLMVFCVSPLSVLHDSKYSMLLSDSIIRHHTAYLNAYRFQSPIPKDHSCVPLMRRADAGYAYQLNRIDGNVVYCYPNGSAILSVPLVAVLELFGVRPVSAGEVYDRIGELRIQKLLAGLLMAWFACIVFWTALLFLGPSMSLLTALGAAFGTPVWSTASRTLWSHTWLILFGAEAAYLLLRCERRAARFRPAILATLLSWMYFVRPTGAIGVACLTAYVFARHREQFVRFAAVGAAWFAGFVIYSWSVFRTLMPAYYLSMRTDWANFGVGLMGTLISPSRGLLVFVPITGFIFYLLIRYWGGVPQKGLAIASIAIVVAQVMMVASWPAWWGGYCYGPRLETDATPWLAVLAILGLAGRYVRAGSSWRLLEGTVGALLLAASALLNGRGAVSVATYRWNDIVQIDQHPERAFDWSYPQFLAGIMAPPNYAPMGGSDSGRSE